jgi:hypothetical protein
MPHRFPPLAPQTDLAAPSWPRLPWAGLLAILGMLALLRMV